MRIAFVVEGRTEKAFLACLRSFLAPRLAGRMPKIDPVPRDGHIETGDKLKRLVERLLADGADAVVALTDVYTGRIPPVFVDAGDAKAKMHQWAGEISGFYPHAAQYEFEAWLLPYWTDIQTLAGSNRGLPSSHPEHVNHGHPPSRLISEVFRNGSRGRSYSKSRDAAKILQTRDLLVSARACPELKALLNTFLHLCDGDAID